MQRKGLSHIQCHRRAGQEAVKRERVRVGVSLVSGKRLEGERGGEHRSDSDRESPLLRVWKRRQGASWKLDSLPLSLCFFHCVCVEKMRSRRGMYESGGAGGGGGGIKGDDEEEGRISCSHSP